VGLTALSAQILDDIVPLEIVAFPSKSELRDRKGDK